MSLEKDSSIRVIGKLGTRVLYYKRDGSYHDRAYVKPVQPGTPAQVTWWNKFATGVTAWQGLSQGQKDSWNLKAVPFHMTGFNYYMRKYLLS